MPHRRATVPPKFLLLTTGLKLGGAEALLIDLAELMRTNGFVVEVLSMTAGGHHRKTLEDRGFRVSDLGMERGTSSATALVRAVRAVRASDADIVQCWMYHANFVGGLVSLSQPRRPVYFGIFSAMMDFSRYNALTRTMFKAGAYLSARCAGICYNGERAARDHEQAGYNSARSIVVRNSVDFARFRPDPDRRHKLRAELGLASDARVVVIAARNDPQKDWTAMLEAARLRPEVTVLATGLGTENLQAPSNVHRLGPRRDIESIYAASDLFMLLSNFGEGTSVALCEAMATGLPVITSDVGDNAMLADGGAGRVIDPSDARGAADAIAEILEDEALYRRMSEAALSRARKLCESAAAFAPLVASYEKSLSRTATQAA